MKRGAAPPPSPRHDERLNYLAAAVAHEIRNPLNAMAIHLELLETRARKLPATEAEAILRSLGVLSHEVERVDGILVQYLSAVGPREAERKPEAVASLLGQAVERARAAADARRVTVEVAVEKGSARWPLDGGAIGHAIDEVLANAIEASARGGAVLMRARLADGVGVVEVEDRGEGIPVEVMPRIFQVGFTTRQGRSGLGLAVAKQIVKGHGGAINARSDGSGRGATVRIELPFD